MTDLRKAILAKLDDWDNDHDTLYCPSKGCIHDAVVALRAVVDLHAPGTRLGSEDTCTGCELRGVGTAWLDRCKTLVAVAEALGIEIKENA